MKWRVAVAVGVVSAGLVGGQLLAGGSRGRIAAPMKLISVHVPGTVGASNDWVNGSGAADSAGNGTCATAGGQNQRLILLGTGYHVPAGAAITGVTVRVWGARTGGGSKPNEMSATLVSNAWRASVPTEHIANFANNSNTPGACPPAGTAQVDLGGPTDLWGLNPTTQLTAANVNDASFGVEVNSGSSSFLTAAVDLVNITIWYRALAPTSAPGSVTPNSGGSFTPGWVTSATPTIGGTAAVTGAAEGATVTLYLDGSASPYCTTTANPTTGTYSCAGSVVLSQGGPHTVKADQQDYDATSPSPLSAASAPFQIDSIAPAVSFTSGPAQNAITKSATASFAFAAADPAPGSGVASLSCSRDGAAFSGCTSPQTISALSDGAHSFAVRGSDNAGNTATVTRTFFVDTVPPATSIGTHPVNPTNATSASFSFTASDPIANGYASGVAGSECRLDGAAYATCASGGTGATFSTLAAGPHTFEVRAIDAAGNAGVAATFSWTVDTEPPLITCAGRPTCFTTPGHTYGSAVTFEGGCPRDGATVRLFIDGNLQANFAVCSANRWTVASEPLAPGSHAATARWVDAGGNMSPAGPAWNFTAAPGAAS